MNFLLLTIHRKEPMFGFQPDTFARRRRRAAELLGDGVLVLPAAPVRYHSGDVGYPYRPDSELFYLTGWTEPGAVAVLRGGEAPCFVLFVRSRDRKAERWAGPRLGPEGAQERFGADVAYPVADLARRLPTLLSGADRVFFRLDGDAEVRRFVIEAVARARKEGARRGRGPWAVVEPGRVLDDLRLIKDPRELERIRRAAAATVAGHRAGAATVGPGVGEWVVQAELEAAFRREGALGPSFATIVASGDNACVLHYEDNRRRMEAGDLVLLDAGAEVDLYAGDVTRTLPVSGHFTDVQRAVYDIVEEARATAVATVRPGATVEDVHRAAVEVMVAGLAGLGVLHGSPQALMAAEAERKQRAQERKRRCGGEDGEAGKDENEEHDEQDGGASGITYREFIPHHTCHWLGLDTHDVGHYARDGEPRRLEPGMVLTVEPGLYFPPDGEHEPADPYRGIGVRIEDDVVVTEEGREVLTSELPTAADDVEAWLADG